MQYREDESFNPCRFLRLIAVCLTVAFLTVPGAAYASEDLESLMTDTPEEGFQLAIKLSQKAVVTTQPDADVRRVLRGGYANDPNSLIHVSHVVAVHFSTIAEANGYWKEE